MDQSICILYASDLAMHTHCKIYKWKADFPPITSILCKKLNANNNILNENYLYGRNKFLPELEI